VAEALQLDLEKRSLGAGWVAASAAPGEEVPGATRMQDVAAAGEGVSRDSGQLEAEVEVVATGDSGMEEGVDESRQAEEEERRVACRRAL
jgi:hypothetical protein